MVRIADNLYLRPWCRILAPNGIFTIDLLPVKDPALNGPRHYHDVRIGTGSL